MKDKLPQGFSSPTALPNDRGQSEWQQQNRAWWEANPMRYDWKDRLGVAEFSREFYQEIDRRFFEDAAHYLPPKTRPFDRLIPFDRLGGWDVLEVGVGSGSHAQLMSPFCRSYTGIDLTEYAVISTRRRFELHGWKGRIERMDAEQMTFADASFDYIWSWGVIHHSADTARILAEMYRVLRPGGTATIMVYHRSALYAYGYAGFLRGIVGGGFRRHSLHELLQLHTDGAIARFYRLNEWRDLVRSVGFAVAAQHIMGQKSEVLLLPAGRIKNALMRVVPDVLTRGITNTLGQGSFLITTLRKPVTVPL